MVDMVAKAKALILGLLASAATTAATVDLTLPPGDYMLVPVQPYTVVTIQSTPVDPPVLDTDGDGVPDDVDACPTEPAQTASGCPGAPPTTDLPTVHSDKTLADCVAELSTVDGGFCQMGLSVYSASRTKENVGNLMWGVSGALATLQAFTGMAWDWPKAYLWGGGHNDGGLIDVLEWDVEAGTLTRIYEAPPYNVLYHDTLYNKYAPRHDASLPAASHGYDGLNFDPNTGLVLIFASGGYTYWYSSNPDDYPDAGPLTNEIGKGIWAFNPSRTETRKGIAPLSWKRVSDRIYPYPFTEMIGDKLFAGSTTTMDLLKWDGDMLVLDRKLRNGIGGNTAEAELIDGILRVRFLNIMYSYDATTWAKLPDFPGSADVPVVDHQNSIEQFADYFLHWNGAWKITELRNNGKVYVCDYLPDGTTPPSNSSPVHSKFKRVPGSENLYVGWDREDIGPIVYKHDPSACIEQLPVGQNLNIQLQNADTVAADPAYRYLGGPTIRSGKTLDLNWSQVDGIAGNGHVVMQGGPGVLKNFRSHTATRAGVWVMADGATSPNVTIDGFDIAWKNFGVITSNEPDGEIVLKNGVILDGTSSRIGYEHNVYIGQIARADVDSLQSIRNHQKGHLFKSRAAVNVITNSLFDGGNSNHSRVLDFPCGGEITITDSTMIQSLNSDNDDLIAIAVESCAVEHSTLRLTDTQWIANKPNSRFLTSAKSVDIVCSGTNEFVGVANPCG